MSLKARLATKALPSDEFRLRISDDTEARAELARAQYALRLAESRNEGVAKTQAAVKKAEAKVESHYETLVLRALPAPEFEALIDAHPPTKKQLEDDHIWNVDTFRPAVFAACIEGDMTESDWVEYCQNGQLSAGEVNELFTAICQLNMRSPGSAVGKGLSQIISSL